MNPPDTYREAADMTLQAVGLVTNIRDAASLTPEVRLHCLHTIRRTLAAAEGYLTELDLIADLPPCVGGRIVDSLHQRFAEHFGPTEEKP